MDIRQAFLRNSEQTQLLLPRQSWQIGGKFDARRELRHGRSAGANDDAGGDCMRRCLLSFSLVFLCAPCFASRTLTDEMGRSVVVPDHPHRVICLMPSVTDTVFALGAGDDVVAISDYTKYPAEALKKPSVGDLVKPSLETIVSLHPDLVIGYQPKGAMEITGQLERLGIPVTTAWTAIDLLPTGHWLHAGRPAVVRRGRGRS